MCQASAVTHQRGLGTPEAGEANPTVSSFYWGPESTPSVPSLTLALLRTLHWVSWGDPAPTLHRLLVREPGGAHGHLAQVAVLSHPPLRPLALLCQCPTQTVPSATMAFLVPAWPGGGGEEGVPPSTGPSGTEQL